MEEEFDEDKFDILNKQLDILFPNPPFAISCVIDDDISELDEKFTDEEVIIIKDDRAKWWVHGFRHGEITEEEASEYIHYAVVKAPFKGNITLRVIIQAMINDPHYSDPMILNDSHSFLEGFEKSRLSSIEYTCYFGS